MNFKIWVNKRRFSACIMSVMMLLIIIFLSVFIAVEADHECTGEDCHICMCIQICENTLGTMGNTVAVLAFSFLTAVFIKALFPHNISSFVIGSPVRDKDRLNN